MHIFEKKSSKKFAGLKIMPTFAIPKSKQPLVLGEKKRNVATQI